MIFISAYPSGVTQTTLGIGVAVAITVVAAFIVCVLLAGVLLFYCISKPQSRCSESETSSNQQQQADLEYEEIQAISREKIELRENMAYGPAQRIELSENVAYEPVQH